MKKIIALSALFGTSTILFASPNFAQTVTVPIIGGNIGINGQITSPVGFAPISFAPSITTVLTPIGTVSISSFDGNISANSQFGNGSFQVVNSAIINPIDYPLFINGSEPGFVPTTFVFTGITNGTAPAPYGAFTNAPTTINSTFSITIFGPSAPIQVSVPITSGSITLPAPVIPAPVIPAPVTCTGCLIVRPQDLIIANSTLQYSGFYKPEYPQEYKNDFSRSCFDRDRITGGLEDK
jgi:hypothetical protein